MKKNLFNFEVTSHIFHFQGQALEAILCNGELGKIVMPGEDIKLNFTPDIIKAFKASYMAIGE